MRCATLIPLSRRSVENGIVVVPVDEKTWRGQSESTIDEHEHDFQQQVSPTGRGSYSQRIQQNWPRCNGNAPRFFSTIVVASFLMFRPALPSDSYSGSLERFRSDAPVAAFPGV
jgi:hypothetical protein